jgi:transcriptional regulator with XRE-family HTH domain
MNEDQPIDLAAILSRLGWQQRDLAREIDVHRNTVSEWYRRVRPIPKVVKLYLADRLKESSKARKVRAA